MPSWVPLALLECFQGEHFEGGVEIIKEWASVPRKAGCKLFEKFAQHLQDFTSQRFSCSVDVDGVNVCNSLSLSLSLAMNQKLWAWYAHDEIHAASYPFNQSSIRGLPQVELLVDLGKTFRLDKAACNAWSIYESILLPYLTIRTIVVPHICLRALWILMGSHGSSRVLYCLDMFGFSFVAPRCLLLCLPFIDVGSWVFRVFKR